MATAKTQKIMHFPIQYSAEGLATDVTDMSALRFLSVWRAGEHITDQRYGLPGVQLEHDALAIGNVMPYVLIYQLAITKREI